MNLVATLAQISTETGGTLVAQNIFFSIIAIIMVFSAFRVVTTKNVVHAALYLVLVLAGVAAIYVLLTAEFIAVVQVLVYIGAIVVLLLFGIMLTEAKLGQDQNLNNGYRLPAVITAVALLAVMSFALWDQFEDQKLPVPAFNGTDDPALVDYALSEHPELFDSRDEVFIAEVRGILGNDFIDLLEGGGLEEPYFSEENFQIVSDSIEGLDIEDFERVDALDSDALYDDHVKSVIESRSGLFNGVQDTEEVSDTIFSTYIIPFEAISVLLLAALIGAIVLARKE